MKLDYKYLSYLLLGIVFFTSKSGHAASPTKHCQPQDLACIQSMPSNSQSPVSNTPVRTYDESGRVISEKIGDTTTYYTYDENGKQHQQYKEKVVAK